MTNHEALRQQRSIDSIKVGSRHRKDLGDLTSLAESIESNGLLQPLTITPDGILICGARRLEALKTLGVNNVSVWVRSGLSCRLRQLLAEREENLEKKDFTPTELAALYAELKEEIAADAAQRKAATQFGSLANREPENTGPGNFPGPWSDPIPDARVQAAGMLGNELSHKTLDKVLEIQGLADDPTRSLAVRELAAKAVKEMDETGKVDGPYQQALAAARLEDLERCATDQGQPETARETARAALDAIRHASADSPMTASHVHDAARTALARIKEHNRAEGKKRGRPAKLKEEQEQPPMKTVAAFAYMWRDFGSWPAEFRPEEVGATLGENDWVVFSNMMTAANTFLKTAAQARREAGLVDRCG